MSYSTHEVAVRGGTMTVGDWRADDPNAPVIVAAHGITASHLAWTAIVEELPDIRFVAPDLRGRGRSSELPGPWGMVQHAEDLAAVSQALRLPRSLVVGHSMGGFVALVAAHLYPELFSGPFLIDGGLPLVLAASSASESTGATLGPAADRLTMTFANRSSYLDFWKAHPAFAHDWNQKVIDYVNYDLIGSEPRLHSSSSVDAVQQDSAELYGGEAVVNALAHVNRPVTLLTAPRGMLDDPPGLYSTSALEHWSSDMPDLTIREVADVNHYTIVMGDGARVVADALRIELGIN